MVNSSMKNAESMARSIPIRCVLLRPILVDLFVDGRTGASQHCCTVKVESPNSGRSWINRLLPLRCACGGSRGRLVVQQSFSSVTCEGGLSLSLQAVHATGKEGVRLLLKRLLIFRPFAEGDGTRSHPRLCFARRTCASDGELTGDLVRPPHFSSSVVGMGDDLILTCRITACGCPRLVLFQTRTTIVSTSRDQVNSRSRHGQIHYIQQSTLIVFMNIISSCHSSAQEH